MTPVVIDASVGVEIVANTARGRRLAALLPVDAVGWVPEHFYAEVAGVLRHQLVVARAITDAQANVALERLRRWHLRRSSVAALIAVAWGFRHNMTTADAIYVALAVELGAMFISDDHKLLAAPNFPSTVNVLRLP